MSKGLKVHVGGTYDAMAARVARAYRSAGRPAKRGLARRGSAEDRLTFVSWSALSKAMTGKRLELLRRLHLRPAASVAALARQLRRDYKRVHADVAALEAAGLITRERGRLSAEYDEIRTVIAL